jgi:hypothetical protein
MKCWLAGSSQELRKIMLNALAGLISDEASSLSQAAEIPVISSEATADRGVPSDIL